MSYILSSKYRSQVLEHLAKAGQATPTHIAEEVNSHRPHISRALSELKDKGVVELRTSDARDVGRYYGLTEQGARVWTELKPRIHQVEWSVAEPSTPAEEAVVEAASHEFGASLRMVAVYDGETVTFVYSDPAVFSDYAEEDIEQRLRTFIFDHSLEELAMAGEESWSEVTHFSDFSLLRVRVTDEVLIAISFDRDRNVSVPDFADTIAERYRSNDQD